MVYNLKNNYKMIKKIYLTISLILFFTNTSHSEENFFDDAKKLFENEKYKDSKFLFQRNITFNPKNADSYLYLAKIFMGSTFKEIVSEAKSTFRETNIYKPPSSRKESKESFIICKKLR